jgi:hypothetical protein
MILKRNPVTLAIQRNPLVLGIVGAAIGLALGGLTAYFVLNQRRSLAAELPFGADLVPQDALVTFSFSTQEGQWRRLREFGTPESQKVLDEALAEWRDRLLTDHGYNYQDDIQPWLGEEATVVILPIPSGAEAGEDNIQLPSFDNQQMAVMLLPIANPDAAQAVLAAPNGEAAEENSRNYKGVQIREMGGEQGKPYFLTVLGGQVVAASQDDEAIAQVIDTYKGTPSVADIAGYRQAFKQVEAAEAFLRMYVNIPAVRESATTNSTKSVPFWGWPLLQNNQGLVTVATLESEGMRLQGVNWLTPNSEIRYEAKNDAHSRLSNWLPENTLLMASGNDFQQFWRNYTQQSVVKPGELTNPSFLQQAIRSTTGLDPEQDLLPWMQGEFSLALMPTSEQSSTADGTSILLMAQVNDRRAAEQTLKKLDEIMSSRYKFQVSGEEVDGQPIVNWVSEFGALTVTRGWVDGNIAFLSIDSSPADAVLPPADSALSEDSLFRKAIANRLASNNGYFFANIDRIVNGGHNIPIPRLPQGGDALLQAIQAIGLTAAIQDERSSRYDILVIPKNTP